MLETCPGGCRMLFHWSHRDDKGRIGQQKLADTAFFCIFGGGMLNNKEKTNGSWHRVIQL